MIRGMILETFSPYSISSFFLQSRAHAYGKHAPDMQSVSLHYIHLKAAISGRKSAGQGGTHHLTLLQEEKGKGQQAVDNCALLEYIGYRSNCVLFRR
jgi:hypothetical protein